MGLFDKLKEVVNTAADSINKAMEESKNAKDPLGDPAVKKYYEVAYGLMKSIDRVTVNAIRKHIEHQLGEPCDETILQKALECYWGSPLYHIITENTFGEDKQKKIEEVNRTLDALNQYRITKEEAYTLYYNEEVEKITAEFNKVLEVVEQHGFKHFKEGMNRLWSNNHENIGINAYYDIVHMIVKNMLFEANPGAKRVLITCLDHGTYRFHKVNGSFRIASIALRALHFEKYGNSEEGYTSITKDEILDFVSNNEEFKEKAKELTEENPFDTKNYNVEFAEGIMSVDIMSGAFEHDFGGRQIAKTECWMPDYETEPYYTDKVCNLYWKYLENHLDENTEDLNSVYDLIWKQMNT